MLGTIDGANSHIAIRVALKAEVVMINSGDTDPTFIETNIPWVARVIGDDRQQAYLLTDFWYRKLGLKRVAIIRSSNRYGRFGVREIRDARGGCSGRSRSRWPTRSGRRTSSSRSSGSRTRTRTRSSTGATRSRGR